MGRPCAVGGLGDLGKHPVPRFRRSVRPQIPRTKELFEDQGDQSHRWKEISDMIPRRNYVDVVGFLLIIPLSDSDSHD